MRKRTDFDPTRLEAHQREWRTWTAQDAKRFLEALADDRLVGMWTLALRTGMRRGDLVGLRWSDVDLKAGTPTVAQQRTSANYEEVITAPKASSYRQLLLAPATAAALREHRKRQRKERLLLGPAWTNNGYLLGVHPKGVQEQLGHSAIAVTLDTYSHVPKAVRRDGADKIAALFGD